MIRFPQFAFGRYLLCAIVPGLLVSVIGVALLVWEGRQAAQKTEQMQDACALNAIDEIREMVRDAGEDIFARHAAFESFATNAANGVESPAARLDHVFTASPVGAFVWVPKKGLLWQSGLGSSLQARLGARLTWNAWATSGKHPPRRAVNRVIAENRSYYLLWGRVANEIYGFIFTDPPVAVVTHTWLWLAAALLVGALTALLIYEAVRLWRSAEHARRDDALKTRFVSDVTHELKTPLAAMGLWLDMLMGGRIASPERRAHALQVVADEKNRLLRLVESLLDFTRLEAGRRQYELTAVDLGQSVRDAVALLSGDFPPDGVRVDATDGLFVRADKDAVREILLNLLGNAAKYAAECGLVEVTVQHRGEHGVVIVADRGPGLSSEALRHVFERFYRAENTTSRAKGGFGLGLPISRGLARGMGGELAAAARDGGGCTFLLELPADL
ncbi:MAG: HAMP domain-containing histidine kinase [Kiritimatiellae bacterium]|nr:HAMP domain-containing histidine kinase [Kiritimatiellia bacterium]